MSITIQPPVIKKLLFLKLYVNFRNIATEQKFDLSEIQIGLQKSNAVKFLREKMAFFNFSDVMDHTASE